jgi:kynurenine formamidase
MGARSRRPATQPEAGGLTLSADNRGKVAAGDPGSPQPGSDPSDLLSALLDPAKLVDLTQPLGPDTVLWPDSDPLVVEPRLDYSTDGMYLRHYTSFPEHAGTHLDAPRHFGGPHQVTAEALPIGLLVRPAVVLDVRAECGGDAAFTLSRAHVEAIEARDGRIPTGSAVLVCTGWDVHRHDAARYVGLPGATALPGLGPDAAALLVERAVAGIGIDSQGIDPGYARDCPAHRITLAAGLWHLEGLVGLERLPRRGAWLVAAAVPLTGASGTPARAFAILP